MTSIVDWLKNTEEAKPPKGGWVPKTSPEKDKGKVQRRTLGYGHKLSVDEELGNYVVLPDGSVHDFDTEGPMDDAAIDELFSADIEKKRKIVSKQWDARNLGKKFEDLDAKYKAILIDIGFQTGSLNNSSGKPSWTKLAKAIIKDDVVAAANESETVFTNKAGNKVKDKRRNRFKRDVLEDITPIVLQQPQLTSKTTSPKSNTNVPVPANVSQTTSQSDTEVLTDATDLSSEEQAVVDDLFNSMTGSRDVALQAAISKEELENQQEGVGVLALEEEEEKEFSAEEQVAMGEILSSFEGKAGKKERLAAEQEEVIEDEQLDNLF